MPGAKLPLLTITNRLYFRDDGMYIDGLTDATLNITSDSAITLDGNVSLTANDTLTVVDGAVNLGTGDLTLGGDVTLAGAKYLEFASGAESLRFPNDGTLASSSVNTYYWNNSGGAHWLTPLNSGNVCGWLKAKLRSGSSWYTMYTPLFSSNTME